MKNIIILSSIGLYYDNTAAITRMNNYAKALSTIKDNRIFLLSRKYFNHKVEVVAVEENIFTFSRRENIPENKGIIGTLSFIRWVRGFIKSLKGKVVILYYPSMDIVLEFCFLFFLRRLNGVHSYCEVNEVRKYASNLQKNTFLNFVKRNIFKLSENTTRFYDGLICISSNIKGYFNNKNRNIIVIPILSDCDNKVISFDKKYCSDKLNKRFLFLFTGSVSIEKENLNELIRGFSLLKDKYNNWECHLYGTIMDSDRLKLKKIVELYGLEEFIYYKGNVDHSKIYDLQSNADCLLLTRTNNLQNYYGFSTKLSEYAVSGTPVILTNTGVVGDYFYDGYNCLMPDEATGECFCMKFVELLNLSNEKKRNIVVNAFLTAEKHFSWKKYCADLDNFLI